MKDSINFLDHINGKNHQRNIGMSMKVKKSSLDDVKARFAFKKLESSYTLEVITVMLFQRIKRRRKNRWNNF